MSKPLVAIVGRPNVGKSTLFNRLARRRVAVVTEIAGTTRDRISTEVVWEGHSMILVDTGGLDPEPESPLGERVQAQAEVAMQEADAIIFLTDVLDGCTPTDVEVAHRLRRTEKPVVLAANKADNERRAQQVAELYELGLGDPVTISAYHGTGIDELMAAVVATLPAREEEAEPDEEVLSLALVGRTNVGKSALLNAILGEERAIVSELPGTTRDALDTPILY